MVGTNLSSRKNKRKKFPKALTLLMALLLIFNGMLPSALIGKVHSVENDAVEQPKISKDVDGETSKEVSKGQKFTYNVNVDLPTDITNYETMVISDDLDQRLDVLGTSVLIDGEPDDTLKTVVDGQEVSLSLNKEEIEELVGKEVKLQLVTQVKENTATGEKIDNVAQVVINDNIEMKTNPVVVTPIDVENKSSESESKDEKITTEESINQSQEKTIEENKDETKASSVESNTKNIAIANSKEMAVNTDNKWLTYKLDGFSNDTVNQLFAVHGAASVPAGSNFIRLTPTATVQSGAVFNKNEICSNNNYSFSTAFSFSMNNQSPQGPSDGLTFTLQTGTSSQLANGGGLGYYGIKPSFAIKYDTFLNDVYKDPSANYIGIAENGTVTNQPGWYTDLNQYNTSNGTNYVLSNGTRYYTWIDYDGLSKNVQVHLGTSPDRANAKKVLDVNNIDLGTIFNGKPIHAGFTASTGFPNYENHDIYNWYFVNDYAPISTLNSQNDYKQAPSSVKLKTEPTNEPGVHKVTATLLDPLGNPVAGASLDSFTSTVGDLAGPNGEPVADLVSDVDGKIQAILKNVDHSKDATISATIGCANDSTTIPATDLPPLDSCAAPVALINGSFEEGAAVGTAPDPNGNRPGIYFYPSEVPGWKTTDKAIEIWNYATNRPSGANSYPVPPDGKRYAELNAFNAGMLYQDVKTTPGQTIYWRLSHMGRAGVDTMQVRIGAVTSNPYDTVVQRQISDGRTAWGNYTGSYTVPAGQTTTRFGFEAVSSASGSVGNGNFLDHIFLGTEPCVTAEKSVSPSGEVFVGDELTYNVTVKNSGGDIAANTVIEDIIPEGTEYVPDSMKILNGPNAGDLTDIADKDQGISDGNKVAIILGDLPNTTSLPDGITIQFKVKALSSQAGKSALNKAQVKYKDLLKNEDKEFETNEVITPIKYKDPVLISEKSATIKEKAAGNTDQDHPEVGDTLLYTIKTQNTVSNSLVKNLIISDKLPEGLEYVADTLIVDGTLVTDTKDTDSGHYDGGILEGHFGDVKDTDWHTLEFQVKVKSGQAGQDIKNIATVSGENVVVPGKPEEEVKVYPRDPVLESEKTAKNLEEGKTIFEVGDTVVYTIRTHNKVSDGIVKNLLISDKLPTGLEYVADSLKVDGKSVTDTKDDDNGHYENSVVEGQIGDITDTDWHTIEFQAKIKSGQSEKTIENIATVSGGNIDEPDQPKETVKVDPKNPVLKSEKSATIQEKAADNKDQDHPEVGDTLLYTIKTQNTIEDSLVKNLVISDPIPDGLEYVAGSLKIDGKSVTDEKDNDNGHQVDGRVEGQFGDVRDTNEHTLEFQVKVKSGQAGHDIKNIATVSGDNVDEPNKPEEEVKVYPRNPVLESEKTAMNLKEGKETFEVGDTVVYTIKTHNKVSDGLLENLVITDELPDGLKYVADSLKVDGKSVTDAKDDDNGHYDNRTVEGQFGDITDTDWHTIEFQATIESGQAEKTITNMATVEGENVVPNQPEENVKVDPKEPVLKSEKSATIQEKAMDNKDTDHPEVGDTLLYTIKTQNTIEDSLVKDLVISDQLPEGLEYVAGSLKVDGKSVTDEKDNDNGHQVDGRVEGQFGDVRDTNEHTLEFQVKVKPGQAGKDITNIATVSGENVDEPNKPEEEVKVYPRDPVLESEKTAKNLEEGKEIFEVGDTVVYTIKTHNKVSDGIVKNLLISDKLPEGLEYVAGSLKVDGQSVTDDKSDDKGHYDNGTVEGQFGDITDTDWHSIEFQAKIKSGQSEKTIENIATVEGGNIKTPDQPKETVKVDPKDPNLVSEKSSKLEKKAEGNTDAEHPEVGDTLLYTIKTQNTIEDSLVKNLVISDPLPEGLEYVAGSLKVDGESVTDEKDNDKGQYDNGIVEGQFGNVRDTNEHILEFQVKVKPGQAGKVIKNIANVTGENVDKPNKPEEEVKVNPRKPVLESEKTAKNLKEGKETFEVGDTVVYTIKTHNKVSDSLVEDLKISDKLPEGLEYVSDSLKVDGKSATDAKDLDNGYFEDRIVEGQFGEITDTEWHTIEFQAKILSGQSEQTIENIALVSGGNTDQPDEPKETVKVDPKAPSLSSEKTAKLEKKADGNTDKEHPEVGDTLLYTIKTKNTIEDSLVKNLVITDKIPDGLEYVSGTLKVDGQAVTDAEGDDKGQYTDGIVTGQLGDVSDTNEHTLTFEVKVKAGQAGQDIKNIATVSGENVVVPNKPEEEVKVYPRDPVLESEKTAKNVKEGKETFEVGDTIVYTIKSRNKVSDGLVKNLVISDKLPEGLEFVEGSLKVDGESVSDKKDTDKGHYENGTVEGQFGDVKDTEWHTLEFYVKVKAGQEGSSIKNIATVTGDNIEQPGKPETEITVKPRDPVIIPSDPIIESEKTAKNQDPKKETIEAGDTVVYTIKARNKATNSVITNLEITDQLPKGLEYVPGSLKVDGQAVTDTKGDDKGHFVDGAVYGQLGNVWDTNWHTVEFLAKVKTGQSGTSIKNIAVVDGDNVDQPSKPETEVTVYPHKPVLESEKTAKNLKEGKETYEVGDTVVYTIKARNTIADSLVKNLSIIDQLPAGLSYVEGSLQVSHNGTGQIKDRKIVAHFGDVKDTEWRTVTFKVKIQSNQSGKEIKNIAIVDSDNVTTPQKPAEEITIDHQDPSKEDPAKENPSKEEPSKEDPTKEDPTKGHPSTDDQNTNNHKNPNPSSPSKDKEITLPKTGDSDDSLMVTTGVLLLLVSAFSIVAARRRRDNR